MTFLCFLGACPTQVALCVGPMLLFRVCSIALNTMQHIQEVCEITFDCNTQFIAETTAHMEIISITVNFTQL